MISYKGKTGGSQHVLQILCGIPSARTQSPRVVRYVLRTRNGRCDQYCPRINRVPSNHHQIAIPVFSIESEGGCRTHCLLPIVETWRFSFCSCTFYLLGNIACQFMICSICFRFPYNHDCAMHVFEPQYWKLSVLQSRVATPSQVAFRNRQQPTHGTTQTHIQMPSRSCMLTCCVYYPSQRLEGFCSSADVVDKGKIHSEAAIAGSTDDRVVQRGRPRLQRRRKIF